MIISFQDKRSTIMAVNNILNTKVLGNCLCLTVATSDEETMSRILYYEVEHDMDNDLLKIHKHLEKLHKNTGSLPSSLAVVGDEVELDDEMYEEDEDY